MVFADFNLKQIDNSHLIPKEWLKQAKTNKRQARPEKNLHY